jgi:hypothetical protein
MSAVHRLSLPISLIAVTALISTIFFASAVARSNPDVNPPIVKWEYNTATVEAGELQTRLAEFGANGWEVFSVQQASQYLEQDQGPKTRLIVEKYQITGRKAVRQ